MFSKTNLFVFMIINLEKTSLQTYHDELDIFHGGKRLNLHIQEINTF